MLFFFVQLYEWWTDYAYLDFRLPLGPLLNYSSSDPMMNHYYSPAEGAQLERTSVIVHYFIKFWTLIVKYGIFHKY